MVTRGSRCEVGATGSQGIFLLLHSTFGLLHFPSLVGTARCAVRAAQSGATRGVIGTSSAIRSARADAGGDIAARCPYHGASASSRSSVGGDGALRRPRREVAAQRGRGWHAARVSFRPCWRGRGHRGAMSLPCKGEGERCSNATKNGPRLYCCGSDSTL